MWAIFAGSVVTAKAIKLMIEPTSAVIRGTALAGHPAEANADEGR